MKKTIILSALMMLFVSSISFASSSKYTIDDNAVETVFNAGVQVSLSDMMLSQNGLDGGATLSAEPSAWVAFILTWVVGGFGLHRVYLGGKIALIPIYFFTCGGIFGIVVAVDWVVLLMGAINNDISKYVGNDKFIMWN